MSKRTQWFVRLFAVCALVMGIASVSDAQNANGGDAGGEGAWRRHAPELSPATGVTALALLSGAILVIRGRRRR